MAPVLVFILVMNAMTQRKSDGDTNMKPIVTLYVLGTFAASLVGVTLSFLFPVTLQLSIGNSEINPPSGIAQVLHTLIMNVVDNPVNALLRANYIGILAWAVIIGLAMHSVAKEETKKVQKNEKSAERGNPHDRKNARWRPGLSGKAAAVAKNGC